MSRNSRQSQKKKQVISPSPSPEPQPRWKVVFGKDFDFDFETAASTVTYPRKVLQDVIDHIRSGLSPDEAVKRETTIWHNDDLNKKRFVIKDGKDQIKLIGRVMEINRHFRVNVLYCSEERIVLFLRAWRSSHGDDARYYFGSNAWTREMGRQSAA